MLSLREEVQAYRYAFERLSPEEETLLLQSAKTNLELAELLATYREIAVTMASSVPQVPAPFRLRGELLNSIATLPQTRPTDAPAPRKIIAFPRWAIPLAAAALVLIFCGYRAYEYVGNLQGQNDTLRGSIAKLESDRDQKLAALQTQLADLQARDEQRLLSLQNQLAAANAATAASSAGGLTELHLRPLAAQTKAYKKAQVLVAWDTKKQQGLVSVANLPAAPAGRDYELWVLPGGAQPPIRAALLTGSVRQQQNNFAPVTTPQGTAPNGPVFAISIEPTGGSNSPTGPIIFVSSGT